MYCIFTGRAVGQPPILKLLRCPILRVFASQGRHDSQINMKFGTAHGGGAAAPNFTLLGGYLGIFGPKNTKICQKIFKDANVIAPQG